MKKATQAELLGSIEIAFKDEEGIDRGFISF